MKFNCLNDLDIVPSIVFRFCQSGFCDVKVCSLNNYWFVQLMVEMSFVNIKHLIEVVSLSRVPHEGALRQGKILISFAFPFPDRHEYSCLVTRIPCNRPPPYSAQMVTNRL